MKAIQVDQFGLPEVMKLTELPELCPNDGQVLVEIKAIGVNPVDTYIRAGLYGPKEFPYTPGFDAAGIVTQVGQSVGNIKQDQRVFISGSVSGTYAQKTLCKPAQIHPLPETVDFEKGAALGIPYRTAYRGLFQRAHASKGETVLIHGASGGVGIAAIQFSKAAGIKVIASAGTQDGRALVAEQGADLTIDHNEPNHLEKAVDFTDGQGVDVVLEMLADINLGNDLPILAKNGRVVIVGSRGSVEINPRDLMSKEANILGLMSNLANQQQIQEAFKAIEKGLEDNTLNPVIAQRFPLAEAAEAHHAVIEESHHGKILLIP